MSVGHSAIEGEDLPADRFIVESGAAATIADLVEPALADLGFRLVRVVISGRDGAVVQVMAERPDGTMTIDDCELVSRQLSPLIDAHDPISGSYRLEVSSPGIDRPLVRGSDFSDWAGHDVRIELKQARDDGRKRFRGVVRGLENGAAVIDAEFSDGARETVSLPLAQIAEAKLVLTDELVRTSLRRAKRDGAGRRAS